MSLCPDCEWINVGTISNPDQVILGQSCPAHKPPPSPHELARAELDDIDRTTGLANITGWRALERA